MSGPAAAPCKMRQMMSIPRLLDMPHRNEATTNRNVDQKYSRTSPMRRASPAGERDGDGVGDPEEGDDPRPLRRRHAEVAAMVGRATLAMVESSTVMAVTTEIPMVAMTSIPP